MHLALPRAVGPYTTIRATKRVSTTAAANIIGTFQQGGTGANAGYISHGNWSNWLIVSSVDASLPINNALNALVGVVDLQGLGDAATLVPSAVTVQVMCPTSLQTASGIVYAGVMSTQTVIAGRAETWTDYMNKFVQFQSPRLLAASKLALRGVQINSYPLNMSQISNFTTLRNEPTSDALATYNGNQPETTGWAPIVIYNPGGATLELLITVEYRVRFDLDNPASASHTHHPIAPDSAWDQLTRKAVALGNGVMDIADVVANTGMAVGRAINVGRRFIQATRALPALAG